LCSIKKRLGLTCFFKGTEYLQFVFFQNLTYFLITLAKIFWLIELALLLTEYGKKRPKTGLVSKISATIFSDILTENLSFQAAF